jgi:hypothetical protein
MTQSTGAPAQKKRALSRIKWTIRRLKPRCCGSLRTTSTLLEGPKTGPQGVYQIQTETLANRGTYCMSIETVLLILIRATGVRLYSRLGAKGEDCRFRFMGVRPWLTRKSY